MSLLRSLYVQGAETQTPRGSENTLKGRNIEEISFQTDGQTDRGTDRIIPFIHRLASLCSSSAYVEAVSVH